MADEGKGKVVEGSKTRHPMRTTVPLALSEKWTGKTGVELAEELGVGDDQIARWRSGGRLPSWDYILEIATRFGYNAHWIVTGEGDPYARPGEADELIGVIRRLVTASTGGGASLGDLDEADETLEAGPEDPPLGGTGTS